MGFWSDRFPVERATSPAQSEKRQVVSIGDPAVISVLGGHTPGNPAVSEELALTLSAVYRSMALIAGSIAGLPLRTLQTGDNGLKTRANSFLDNPGGDIYTPFEWKELIMFHCLAGGNSYLQHRRNGAGQLAALHPVHPHRVHAEWDASRPGGKKFTVYHDDGSRKEFDASTMTQIMGPSLDGLRGLSVITLARLGLATGIAGDRSAWRMFTNGSMISGMVSPSDAEDELDDDDIKTVKNIVNRVMTGPEHAGDIAVMNRKLQFTPWMLSAVDAQFLESRTFSIEELGRWFGLPPHLLGLTEKSTSWGAGIAEQNRGLSRYTLMPWTNRVDERLSTLIPRNREVEFDYAQFVESSPDVEIKLIIEQVNSGLLTLNEGRAIRNLGPLPGGDIPRTPAGAAPAQDPNAGKKEGPNEQA